MVTANHSQTIKAKRTTINYVRELTELYIIATPSGASETLKKMANCKYLVLKCAFVLLLVLVSTSRTLAGRL